MSRSWSFVCSNIPWSFFTLTRAECILSLEAELLTPDRLDCILSLKAEFLIENAPRIVWLSEGTCLISLSYFNEHHRFEDFPVHEAAHVFHNCKRATVGRPQKPRHEWLLEIDVHKRETFAYACEAFSRVVDLSLRSAERPVLVEE